MKKVLLGILFVLPSISFAKNVNCNTSDMFYKKCTGKLQERSIMEAKEGINQKLFCCVTYASQEEKDTADSIEKEE